MSSGTGSDANPFTGDNGPGRSGPSKAAPLDRMVARATTGQAPKIQQPKPQTLPSRGQGSAILISTKQKGNPVIGHIRGVPWEWAETPADYVLGQTTCALFLSLKYHRLHPEYIYQRIKGLQGKFNLRIILTMVDIPNHEDSLKELSKTSLINNVTLILCWSAQEGGRYLELFKSYEHAAPTTIKAHQSTTYSDRLVDFITVPRSVNKTDAVSLVSNFGSLRTAINASPEEIGMVAGWGGKKVQRWCGSVREPFRVKKAARRGPSKETSRALLSRDVSRADLSTEKSKLDDADNLGDDSIDGAATRAIVADVSASARVNVPVTSSSRQHSGGPQGGGREENFGMVDSTAYQALSKSPTQQATSRSTKDPYLSEGIAAALERLRKQ